MKKFGVSTDWLAKRSNSLCQASYSRSSVKSNTSKLDAMIKSASAKPIRSNRKLSFVEPTTPTKIETDKENTDPSTDTNEKKEESKDVTTTTSSVPTPYDLSSEIDEDKEDNDSSPTSKEFSLRIPRVNFPAEENKRLSKRSNSSSDDDGPKQEKPKPKKKRRSKKETAPKETVKKRSSKKKDKDEQAVNDIKQSSDEKEQDEQAITTENTEKSSKKKDKDDKAQSRIEHLKKLLRISGVRLMIKKTELDELSSDKAKINYLKSLFDAAGFTGNLTIKDCEKFRKKRDAEKELLEIQSNIVDVKGHVIGGRTLRGEGRTINESDLSVKRKRVVSSEVEDNDNSSDDEKPIVKKQRILKMEPSPEVSENE